MIKAGISGCDDLRGHELVRVLINHPDVELMWVTARNHVGSRLEDIVPGLKGESDLMVTAVGSLDNVDLVFTCGCRDEVSSRLPLLIGHEGLHVVNLSGCHNVDYGDDLPWKYGLGEMQRRLLVHDTRLVTVPGNVAAASLLALLPLARSQMLASPLSLHVSLGTVLLSSGGTTLDGITLNDWATDQRREVEYALKHCQEGFDQPIDLEVTPLDGRRTLAAVARMNCSADGEMLRDLYEQYYDDHNFVFMMDRSVTPADVENTNKCLICLEKDERAGILTVTAMMDALLKGAVGTAVHAMNLMFGLQERVGLSLKAIGC